MVIETEEDTIPEFFEALDIEPHQPGPKPKKLKIEEKLTAKTSNPRVSIISPQYGVDLITNFC